ncbi:unnamed protein product [Soboliphyme baturini]|uniref:Afadin n=1 Tax=Soboliphyme baturini TaxID=241478 RepID=A0A183IEE8_9BILA|nr:unnamed protein product [Soboliphyme baturini]
MADASHGIEITDCAEGGSLKIYGEELSATRPYVTLLVSMRDRTDKILRDTLDKYGFDVNDQANFCLVEVEALPTTSGVPEYRENVLDDDDCPLIIIARGDPSSYAFLCPRILYSAALGAITFHVRRRQNALHRYKSYGSVPGAVNSAGPLPSLERYGDGKEQPGASRIFVIRPNVTEVGCDRALNSSDARALCLFGQDILPRHCVIAYMDNTTTITPCSRNAEVLVEERRIFDTTILKQGNLVRIGQNHLFQFYETGGEICVPHKRLRINPHVNTSKGDRSFVSTEDEFLRAVIRDVNPALCSFKLTAAYVVYMCSFSRLSERYLTGISTTERKRRLRAFLHKVTGMIQVTVQDHCHDAESLAFWMANSSEILNFVKRDRQLTSCAQPEPEESLADTVQKAFEHLIACFKQDLHSAMPPLLDPQLEDGAATDPCLQMLSEVLRLLGTYGVSAALNIQIFSQLFHYINMYLFNWLISRDGSAYCCRSWGRRLSRCLHFILMWAEEQGLELAAECRLERILQTAFLLGAFKSEENVVAISERCTRLNSLQIRCILDRYHVDSEEPPLGDAFIDQITKAAEQQVDEALVSDGQQPQVEEDLELYLPLLLPEDGYSPEVIQGIPDGLREFVECLSRRGLCQLHVQKTSNVSWQANFVTELSTPSLVTHAMHFCKSRYDSDGAWLTKQCGRCDASDQGVQDEQANPSSKHVELLVG